MPTGRVKWYDADKGFGFLAQDGGADVYVRKAALPAGVQGLKPGQRVEFGMAEGRRGPQALSVPGVHVPGPLRSLFGEDGAYTIPGSVGTGAEEMLQVRITAATTC